MSTFTALTLTKNKALIFQGLICTTIRGLSIGKSGYVSCVHIRFQVAHFLTTLVKYAFIIL